MTCFLVYLKKYHNYLWWEYFLREVVLLNEEENKVEIHKNKKNKLPFAVFISPNNKSIYVVEDYREIFTDIISDRINQKYKWYKTKICVWIDFLIDT